MNSNQFSRGDILRARDRNRKAGWHYIIYYEPNSSSDFIGGMITRHTSPKNASMTTAHFLELDENGNPFQVAYNNSNLVIAKLIKFEGWGPFTKVGQLSIEGVQFLEGTIDHLPPMSFAEYYYLTHS